MSYQGVLTDVGGNPVPDGTYGLTFRLYTLSSGGVALWTETQSPVPVADGEIAVVLGNVTPLGLPFDQVYWLSVSVNGGPELSPRTELTAAPYALAVRTPLPPGTVDAQTIADEPGIAQTVFAGSLATIGNSCCPEMSIVLSVTITTPGAGYILVSASGMMGFNNVTGEQSTRYQIAETTGSADNYFTFEPAYIYYCGFGSAPNTSYIDIPYFCQRVFAKGPGTYKFSFGTQRLGSFNPTNYAFNPVLNAVYLPSAYGTVMASASGPQPAAVPTSSSGR